VGARGPAHGRGREADDHHVGRADQIGQAQLPLFSLEVERHERLVHVEGLGCLGPPAVLGSRPARALGPLDGRDPGAEVGEVGAGERGRQVGCNLQDVQTGVRHHVAGRLAVDGGTEPGRLARAFALPARSAAGVGLVVKLLCGAVGHPESNRSGVDGPGRSVPQSRNKLCRLDAR
jgi:hypothetical protein